MKMLLLARPSTALLTRARLRLAGGGLVACLALAHAVPASAQAVPPDLGEAAPYVVLGTNGIPTSGTVTCTDTGPGTEVDGDVGTTGNSITNTGCTITGAVDAPVAGTVVSDFDDAYDSVETLNPVCDGVIPITTTTLPPGVYCSAAGTTVGAGVIITLDGDADDVWVFRVGTSGLGALTLNSAQVVMGSAAQACNVYWTTAEAATLTNSDFVGTILSGTAITMTDGSWFGRALATTDVAITDAAPLAFAGCGAADTITVSKDFSDNNAAAVQIDLTCTSGTVSATPLSASEGAPAVFQVAGAGLGATCTATETVPAGYTANQTDCVDVPVGGACTITNTLQATDGTVTVIKDFAPDSAATVSVSLTCTSGTVTTTPLAASEATPAVFNVTGADPGATCTATEAVPFGYIANQVGCQNVAIGGTCTITNTAAAAAPTTIPSGSTLTMILLGGLLALVGLIAVRRFAG